MLTGERMIVDGAAPQPDLLAFTVRRAGQEAAATLGDTTPALTTA